uniref:ATP synthase subunit 8 n=1 Tax=Thrips brunneus TaxID=3118777 RepID=UPI0030DE58AA
MLPMYIPMILSVLIFSIMIFILLNETKWSNKTKISQNLSDKKVNKFFLSLFIS